MAYDEENQIVKKEAQEKEEEFQAMLEQLREQYKEAQVHWLTPLFFPRYNLASSLQ